MVTPYVGGPRPVPSSAMFSTCPRCCWLRPLSLLDRIRRPSAAWLELLYGSSVGFEISLEGIPSRPSQILILEKSIT